MSAYDLTTVWRIDATLAEVMELMGDPLDLPRWWGSVYLSTRELDPGDPTTGVGKRVEMFARGILPYKLRFELSVTENRYPHGISYVTSGELEGEGEWRARQDGQAVELIHIWKVRPQKRIVRWLSPFLKPMFSRNHHWAMDRGLESLRAELSRRRRSAAA